MLTACREQTSSRVLLTGRALQPLQVWRKKMLNINVVFVGTVVLLLAVMAMTWVHLLARSQERIRKQMSMCVLSSSGSFSKNRIQARIRIFQSIAALAVRLGYHQTLLSRRRIRGHRQRPVRIPNVVTQMVHGCTIAETQATGRPALPVAIRFSLGVPR